MNNQEKTEFSNGEQFKILINENEEAEENTFTINVQAEVQTKPIYYGKAPNSNLQNYAITQMYENGYGEKQEETPKQKNTKKEKKKNEKKTNPLPITGM